MNDISDFDIDFSHPSGNGYDFFNYAQQNKFSPKPLTGPNDVRPYGNYDMEKAQQLGMSRNMAGNHMGDAPKLPWHPAFSNESAYYKPGMFAVDWDKASGKQIDASRDINIPTTPWIKRGAAMTKDFEGFKSKPYKDTKNIWTKGYGFNIPANNMDMSPISKEAAGDVFAPLYVEAMSKAKKYAGPAWNSLSPQQQMILTDMRYNLGDKLNKFTDMQTAVQSGDSAGVKREMKDSNWYTQVGRRGVSNVANW